MKRIVCFLLLVSSFVYGQEKKYTVSGVVTDCKTKLSIIDFPVKIVCSDGKVVETKTDINGKYIIELYPKKLPISCVAVFYTEKNPISCLYTGEKTKFTIEDLSINNRVEDMCLVNIAKAEAIVFPDILFKNGSTSFSSDNENEKIVEMAKIMQDHPTFIIEISGFKDSSETNIKLAEERAKKVFQRLEWKGIDRERMFSKGNGNSSEKKVTFSVLRKDYIPHNYKDFILLGTVTDCKTKDPIVNAEIKLVCDDNRNMSCISDSLGHYSFGNKTMKRNRRYSVTVQSNSDTYSATNPRTKDRGYFSTSDKIVFDTKDTNAIQKIADFCLIKNIGCRMVTPVPQFEKNSSTKFHFADTSGMTFSFLYQIMEDNPSFKIEIGGHASNDEKKPFELGLKRAEMIHKEVIKSGIDPDRVIIKSYSNSEAYTYFDENTLESILMDKDNEECYKMNRRVIISIASRDYVPKNPTKKLQKNNSEIEEGE